MSSDNPYQPPATNVDVVEAVSDDVWALVEPRKLTAGRSWAWIAEGFRLFARSPGIWIVNMILFFIITIFIALIPVISIVNYILQPIFIGGLMRGTHTIDTNGEYEVNHLFCGFKEKGSNLAVLGALQLGIMILYAIVIVIVMFALFGSAIFLSESGVDQPDPNAMFAGAAFIIFIPFLIITILLLSLAFWLSPPLVILHDQEAFASIKLSFSGSMRNLLPIILFGIMLMVFFIIALIPFGLGLFVMWPVAMAAIYAAWKDIFTNANPV